ncbi:MAG: exosortase/archaeosortase family protein [Opitutales bacterium]
MSTSEGSQLTVKDLPKLQLSAAVMLVGFALYLVWDQLHWWGNREDYSFGYLVPLFVAYVIYDRWPKIRGLLGHGADEDDLAGQQVNDSKWLPLLEGLAFAAGFVCILLFGTGALIRAATGPQDTASLVLAGSFAGLVLSTLFIFAKERADGRPLSLRARIGLTLLFLFPALIWMLSAPMVSFLETKVRVFLLSKVTVIVFGTLDFLGFELQREGNILVLPDGSVGVEEACSGIRSLTACLFAGSFLAAVFLDRFWKKGLLVAAAMCLAVLTNLIRSMFLTLWAYHHGAGAIDAQWTLPLIGEIGTVHDVTGMLILVLTCIGLLCLLPLFNLKLTEMDDSGTTAEQARSAESQDDE